MWLLISAPGPKGQGRYHTEPNWGLSAQRAAGTVLDGATVGWAICERSTVVSNVLIRPWNMCLPWPLTLVRVLVRVVLHCKIAVMAVCKVQTQASGYHSAGTVHQRQSAVYQDSSANPRPINTADYFGARLLGQSAAKQH